jgi:hypothetical protein
MVIKSPHASRFLSANATMDTHEMWQGFDKKVKIGESKKTQEDPEFGMLVLDKPQPVNLTWGKLYTWGKSNLTRNFLFFTVIKLLECLFHFSFSVSIVTAGKLTVWLMGKKKAFDACNWYSSLVTDLLLSLAQCFSYFSILDYSGSDCSSFNVWAAKCVRLGANQ